MSESNPKAPYPVIDPLECKACGRCIAVCPKKVIEMGHELNARGYLFSRYKGEGCIGCLNCFYSCPEPNAIEIHLPERKSPDKGRA
jgi:2-oxoisovalerate ferredoxin oxidoreductase delta subunit